MKKLPALFCTLVLTLLASAIPAHAQVKIGTVDMDKVFKSYYKTKDAESRINEARAEAKKDLDERMESYKANLDVINKLNEDLQKSELSKDKQAEKAKQRDDKINETKNLEREITEFRTTREKQLQEQAVRMRNGIVDEITKLIQDKVKSDNYDYVLDRSGTSLNGVPVVLFARDATDFSDDIITQLNKNRGKDTSSAASSTTPAPASAIPTPRNRSNAP
ncbi:MAG: OmpH family outer membrane protein [Chthoniobacteraceae bacterium]